MIEFKWTLEEEEKARKYSKDTDSLRGSITSGEGSLAGAIGEIKVAEYLGAELTPTYDYDLTYKDFWLIDVKTKRTTMDYVSPQYEASISDWNTHQRCHFYLFTRVNMKLRRGWMCGFVSPIGYGKIARFLKKGDIDGSNRFVVRADCWNVEYSNLNSVDKLLSV